MHRRSSISHLRSSLLLLSLALPASVTVLRAQDSVVGRTPAVAEEQDFSFATGLYRDSVFQMAIEQFGQFVARYPESARLPEVRFLWGESLFHLGRTVDAIQKYTEIITGSPSARVVPDALFRRGQAFLQIKKNTAAINDFRRILDSYGDSPYAGESAYWIAEGSLKNADYDNAIKYYTLAYEGYPESRVRDYCLYSLGWTYQQKKDYPRATRWYEREIREFPGGRLGSTTRIRLAECSFETKEYRKALSQLGSVDTSALDQRDDASYAAYLGAESKFRLGEYAGAVAAFCDFLKAYPDHRLNRQARYSLGWAYLSLKKADSAAIQFDALARGSDDIAEASLYRSGVMLADAGRSDSAVTVLASVAGRFPSGTYAPRAMYEAAGIQYGEGRWSEAQTRYEETAAKYPRSEFAADALRMSAECRAKNGDYRGAAEKYARASADTAALPGTKAAAMFGRAWSLLKAGEANNAVEAFEAYERAYPNAPQADEARFWRGEGLYALGRFGEAKDAYAAAGKKSGGKIREDALYGEAWSLLKLEKFSDAVLAFEKVVAEYPKGRFALDARLRMADAYLASKDYANAAAGYRSAIRLFPDSTCVIDEAYYKLGQCLQKQNDFAGAFKAFSVVPTVMPKSPLADDARYAMGWMDFQRKEYNEAVKEFQTLIREYPESELAPRALYSIGDAFYNQQMYVPAEQAYREVQRRYPESRYASEAVTGIQYCLIARGKENEAYGVIDEFLKDNPDAPNAQELALKKGELLYTRKRYNDAAKEYRAFLAKYPGSRLVAQALYWLGDCYRQQGNAVEAAQTFERTEKVADPKPEIVGKAVTEAGMIYLELGQNDRAAKAFDNAEKLAVTKDVAAHAGFLKGFVAEIRGNSPAASVQYERVIEIYPHETGADESRVHLARLLIAAHQFERASELAASVSRSRSDGVGAEAQVLVGDILTAQKDWTSAERAYLRVRYVFPSAEEWIGHAYLGLGNVYEQQRQIPKAREAYGKAAGMKKYPAVSSDGARKLKSLGGR